MRTEQSYCGWVKRFVLFHNKRHPHEMGAVEVTAYLSYLANQQGVSSSTHQQALSALLFLYKEVLGCSLPWLDELSRPKKSARLPTVLTKEEILRLFSAMSSNHLFMAKLLYGTGMRLMELLNLRIKHIGTIQELLGHSDVSTTMIYTHVLNKGGMGVYSPLDQL